MLLVRRLIVFIIIQIVLMAAFFVILTNVIFTLNTVIFMIIIEAFLLAGLYKLVGRPLVIFRNLLVQCLNKKDSIKALLDEGANHIVFVQAINNIVKTYSGQLIKESYDKQAELAALQSQINPHFLYNTLDSIRAQALIDNNTEIAQMVESLAGFFRYSISRKGELVTLRDELANVENYMMIHQYRFGDRFAMRIQIEKEDEAAYDNFIPRLIIQPVVENAIYHGLKEKLEGGVITIKISLTERNLILVVSDNGHGMDHASLTELNNRIQSAKTMENKDNESKKHSGIALSNINKRIQLLFGEEYGIHIYSTQNLGTDVEFIMPANFERLDEERKTLIQ